MKRLLVTGSRDWLDYELIDNMIYGYWRRTGDRNLVVVHGACPTGADWHASVCAATWGFHEEPHPADWKKYGKAAGFIRNQEMVDTKPDTCYAFIKDNSPGATHTANAAKKAGIETVIFRNRQTIG